MDAQSLGLLALVTGVAYLLGSLPFAVWISRAHGVDIFRHGSGNPGATNVKRVVGTSAGNATFLLDFGKGLVAVQWFRWIDLPTDATLAPWLPLAALLAALIGHSFSVFLRFRGGKGVAVTMGGLLGIIPVIWLTALVVWLIVFGLVRVVSVASVAFALALPFLAWGSAWVQGEDAAPEVLWLTGVVAFIIVGRHLSNLRRFWRGEEFRFVKDELTSENPNGKGESDSPPNNQSHGSGH